MLNFLSVGWGKGRIVAILLAIVACFISSRAEAQSEVSIAFQPDTTRIEFTLDDVLHTVHGTFRLKSGNIHFDPATGVAGGALVVDATTGASGNDIRDRKMKNEILETARYPEAVFVPSRVVGTLAIPGTSDLQVPGTFQIHGAEHAVTLIVHAQVADNQVQFQTSFTIPFVKWGMRDPSTFVLRVKKEVAMRISGTESISH